MMRHLENRTPYLWLKWVTTLMAIAYALLFFARLISNRATFHASGLDGDIAVPGNPQAMIALCFVMLVLSVWFLKGKSKVAVAVVLYFALIGFFAYWWRLTREIKLSIGRPLIPQTDLLDNVLIGSTALDPVAFAVAIIMLVLAIQLLLSGYLERRLGPDRINGGVGAGLSSTRTHI